MVTVLKGLSKDILEDKFMPLKLAQRIQIAINIRKTVEVVH